MVSHVWQRWDMRIVIADLGTASLQQFQNCECRRFTWIIHILLICHSQYADPAALDRLAFVVQRFSNAFDYILRHSSIDFASQFDEACVQSMPTCCPGQIKWIDRDTVTTKSRTGIKCLEAE